jgi:hypothetical protein
VYLILGIDQDNQEVADFLCSQLWSEYGDKYELGGIKGVDHGMAA